MALVYEEIIFTRELELVVTVKSQAREVADMYNLACDDEQVEMDILIGNFEPTNVPIDEIFDEIFKTMIEGHQ